MFSLSIVEILSGAAAMIFPFWPVLMLMPLASGSSRRRSSPNVAQFLVVWVALLMVRSALFFYPGELPSFLIPEPLSTTLFVVTGAALIGLVLVRRRRARGRLWTAAADAQSAKDLMDLSARQFEEMAVEMYRALGHDARRTGAVGDHGVDVVVNAKNGEKWVVQCKRWRGNVGEPVVRDFYGVLHHEKADRGMLVTTGGFTEQARAWAKGKPLTLIDGPQFLTYVKRARAETVE